jgi:hypothetical protein
VPPLIEQEDEHGRHHDSCVKQYTDTGTGLGTVPREKKRYRTACPWTGTSPSPCTESRTKGRSSECRADSTTCKAM